MSGPATTAILILAAGGSRRLGRPKQLLRFKGRTLLGHALQTALASRCRPVVAILGSLAETMRAEVEDLDAELLTNRRWRAGMSTSIRAGIEYLDSLRPRPQAVVIMTCDQPLVGADLLDRLVEEGQRAENGLVACRHQGRAGVPAYFQHKYFEELRNLKGDEGARSILRDAGSSVALIDDPLAAVDIDTVEDYEQLLQG